jgi:hypothetical protein
MVNFSMNLNKNEKILEIAQSSFFRDEDVESLMTEYFMNIIYINPKEYVMIFNCQKILTVKHGLLDTLEKSCNLFIATGFQKIIFICPSNFIVKVQLKRICERINMNVNLVNTMEEALKIARA